MDCDYARMDIRFGFEVCKREGIAYYRGSSTDWCWFEQNKVPWAEEVIKRSEGHLQEQTVIAREELYP